MAMVVVSNCWFNEWLLVVQFGGRNGGKGLMWSRENVVGGRGNIINELPLNNYIIGNRFLFAKKTNLFLVHDERDYKNCRCGMGVTFECFYCCCSIFFIVAGGSCYRATICPIKRKSIRTSLRHSFVLQGEWTEMIWDDLERRKEQMDSGVVGGRKNLR